ncbi:MAG: 4a-hydroxytetrahydrobiopterin dehydratase [Candidatus Marinimicrobia bacterium]|jgi:4a-hydroxytetrahydrobiopterin dehydratase|nr:4a-hydroxytetrahydrobiopterin dehydratase [Candidatus Neomarinimicrobiota bacterium]MBT3501709.1 4a-hydroxytetrahydrobiopterin dehydratase [Candidatus Neomarinimicrobiota bacterium]MBT3839706.1 4a-hydroxytetrahydrobiopterin dehydratase [Candidatus Neomarinimicrobiota bacterium]MBT3999094.1 4a-hydroxytetrahydrobiopterin dehydratase [Candidatus Neomarinimicrobiota bacterium]MBT4282331.1 4a-hydroxytetrahydrobiopterin dehydratase [Candidatus Neomarinimicrobiota bacterium]
MTSLPDSEIRKSLSKMNGWKLKNQSIQKTFTFKTYMDSIDFINQLAIYAEEANHHPDMIVGWCNIHISFTSHDHGGVTSACIGMAKNTDKC